MYHSPEFQKFVASEHDNERHASISSLVAREPTWQRNLLMWQVLGLLPSRLEKSRLAHALRVPQLPGSEWAMASYLLTDADQDIIGNSVNSLNFSRNRALAHRMLKFFALPERPQRVLYCLARYAEETIDSRMACHIAPFLQSDLSDAFLARSFNALFRLGVKDDTALRVAGELVANHIDATNMDRKAAVSAIVYLCFAGSRDDIAKLKTVRDGVTIPELRRLLNWGFADIERTCGNDFGPAGAKAFFARAVSEAEPNFSGFGCFSSTDLATGLNDFLNETTADPRDVVRTVLALGDAAGVETLAIHPRFSVAKAIHEKNADLLKLWVHFLPTQSPTFVATARCAKNLAAWRATWNDFSPEVLFVCPTATDFLDSSGGKQTWQALFETSVKNDLPLACQLLSAQILALEKQILGDEGTGSPASLPAETAKTVEALEKLILKNTGALLQACMKSNKSAPYALQDMTDRVYGVLVGGTFSPQFVTELFRKAPFSATSWAFNAFALAAPNIDHATLKEAIRNELEVMLGELKNGGMAREDYLLEVISRFQGILVGADRFQVVVSKENLEGVHVLTQTIQTILDAIDASTSHDDAKARGGEDEAESEDEGGADWNGHVAVDKPIVRWNAVLQTCLKKDLSAEEKAEFEGTLREAMRVAPHVEKRWVVRALVKLGTDDAIKAILYQALQHADTDFVAHTIRELLPSRHPRAQQALIRCVGRNSVNDDLKLTILDEMSLDNPQDVLQELRTLEILRLPQHIDDAIRDAVGRVAALIDVDSQLARQQDALGSEGAGRVTSQDLDLLIKKQIPEGDSLSVEVRSALRTAEMILIQSRHWVAEAVDLSPIVNMHSKAVELTLRETFEPYTDALIRKGVLSRKLDVLGYARPIPEKMQIFEDALASLPVVKTIPYFSKFKLRKMLRAICLYRPGKRFTLDGPKAFALLFLVASRKQCPFGLEKQLELGFASDLELFEFIKLIHSLQDSRNRAVHEGLTWDAKDEIEGMRQQAYRIIEHCIRIGRHLQKSMGRPGATGRLDVGA